MDKKLNRKKLVAGTLAALTIVSALPAPALAAQPDTAVPYYAVLAQQNGADAAAPFALATLQEQITAAPDGVQTTITLQGDTSEDVSIPAGKNILLDLDGHALTNVSGHTITNSGTLTIQGTGTVDNITNRKAAVYNNEGGTVILNGGKYTRSLENGSSKTESGGNSYYNLVNEGTMTINAGVEVIQTGNYSSMVENGFYNGSGKTTSPKLTINGGSFSGGLNTVKNDDRGVLEITGGTFSNVSQTVIFNWNKATIVDGNFSANAGAQAVILNGQIDDAMDVGELTIHGGSFTAVGDSTVIGQINNGAQKSVGSIEINDGTFATDSGKLIKLVEGQEDKASINIVKGSFSTSDTAAKEALRQYVDPTSELDPATGTVAALPAERAAASISGKNYATFEAALAAAQAGDTIRLEADVRTADFTEIHKALTIDFAGHKLESDGSGLDIYADLTLRGGTLNAAKWCLWVQNGATVNIEKDMTLNADLNTTETNKPAVVVEGTAAKASTVNIEGTVTAINNFAVSGNGSTGKGNVIINIKDGANISSNETAVYMPNTWELNISGGTITGATGVYIKSGTTSITGGTIIGTAAESNYEYKGDGANATGQAVVIDKCGYPGGDPTVEISGGSFVAEKASTAIGSYTGGSDTSGVSVEKFVTGGSFSASLKDTGFLSDSLTAELRAASGADPYSYYATVDEAKAAAQQAGGGVVTDLTAAAVASFTVTLKFENGEADQTFTVQENGALLLPTPTRSGSYSFLHWTNGTSTYSAGSEYTVTGDATLTAVWSYTGTTSYAITVSAEIVNGTVSVSPRYASRGRTVTVTVTPDAGYVLGSLTVTDRNGNALTLTDKGDGQYSFTMPAGRVSVNATFVQSGETGTFRDVPAGSFYYDAVEWAVAKGITPGTSADTFSPELGCTRAETVTFLWRAAGSPEPQSVENPFADVSPDAYYYKAVLWAIEQGITVGTSATTFSPDATVTRAQTVTFLARAARAAETGSSRFEDVADDAYYANAVLWAERNSITTGTGEGKFSPNADCTRAQIVTFLWRAYHD